jgi:hypothetical protein
MRRILRDGTIFSLAGSLYLLALLWHNPRLVLNEGDYPPDVLAAAPPKTDDEQRQAIVWGIPFLLWSFAFPLASARSLKRDLGGQVSFRELFLHVFGVLNVFNLTDLIVLDWLVFCTLTPGFLVIPGTEGLAGYKDYGFHLKGHMARGLPLLVLSAAAIAAVAWLLPGGSARPG